MCTISEFIFSYMLVLLIFWILFIYSLKLRRFFTLAQYVLLSITQKIIYGISIWYLWSKQWMTNFWLQTTPYALLLINILFLLNALRKQDPYHGLTKLNTCFNLYQLVWLECPQTNWFLKPNQRVQCANHHPRGE